MARFKGWEFRLPPSMGPIKHRESADQSDKVQENSSKDNKER